MKIAPHSISRKQLICLALSALGLALSPAQAATWNVNPSNYHTELAKVNNGDTVNLADGTYVLNSTDITNITRRSGVTYSGNKYGTIFTTNDSTKKEIKFDSKSNITLKGIQWKSMQPYLRNCQNHKFDWSRIFNYKNYNSSESIPVLMSVYLASEGETIYTNLIQNYNTFVMKGISYQLHGNSLLRKNRAEGKLRGAYDHSGETVNLTFNDNYGERSAGGTTSENGRNAEDHATYHHDIVGLTHLRNTMKGWSNTSFGGGVKIKNVKTVNVSNNIYYTSGILGRIESTTGPIFQDVWIRGNVIHQGDLNIWTPGTNPIKIRVEGNTVSNGGIQASNSVLNSFNWNVSFTWSNGTPIGAGGVYNNQAKSYSLASVINQSGNQTL